MDQLDSFLKLNERGLKIAEAIHHRVERGRCLNNIGIAYHRQNDYSLAVEYFLVTVIDAYSRYVVAWDLCWQLTDDAMALVLRQALDRTPGATPDIVTDNAPEFIGRDFLLACKAESLKHIRTRVYHPQSNGCAQRYNRTFREEGWAGQQPEDYPAALALITEWVQTYNTVRLHSALQYLTPWDYYRGDPAIRLATRRSQLQQARLRRREASEAYYAAAPTAA